MLLFSIFYKSNCGITPDQMQGDKDRHLNKGRICVLLHQSARRPCVASAYLEDWPPSIGVTRSNRVRFRYGSRVCLPRLRRRGCPRSPLDRLHVQRSIHMTDSFHPVRTAKLCLAYQILRKTHIVLYLSSSQGIVPPVNFTPGISEGPEKQIITETV